MNAAADDLSHCARAEKRKGFKKILGKPVGKTFFHFFLPISIIRSLVSTREETRIAFIITISSFTSHF